MKAQALLTISLAANSKAAAPFDKLPPSHRKEYASWIAGAKREETPQRRLKQLIPLLLKKHAKR